MNVETKEIVGIEVTDETVSDGAEFNSLVTQAGKNLGGGKIELHWGMVVKTGERYSTISKRKGYSRLSKHGQMPAQNQMDLL